MQVHERLVYGTAALSPVAGRWRKTSITLTPEKLADGLEDADEESGPAGVPVPRSAALCHHSACGERNVGFNDYGNSGSREPSHVGAVQPREDGSEADGDGNPCGKMIQTQSNGTCVIQICLISWGHPKAPERRVMTQTMTQTPWLRALAPSKSLRELVDLAGIEPATSSMPWKRAPSCATGPLYRGRIPWGSEFQEGTLSILAYRGAIVNAPHILNFFHFLSTGFSAIIDCAPHLHNFSNTI
jgi:hypothetical protein